jgi:hypothetical protein
VDALETLRTKSRLLSENLETKKALNPVSEVEIKDNPEWISFRVTPEQKAMLKSACQDRGISVSDWVKARVFDLPLPQSQRIKPTQINSQAAIALNRIGTNLNQLTRKLNQDKPIGFEVVVQLSAETKLLIYQILIQLSRPVVEDAPRIEA